MNRFFIKFTLGFLTAMLPAAILASGFSVPVVLTPAVSVGYDSNFLKLSDEEMDRADLDRSYLGDSENFDSAFLKPEFRLQYAPYLLGENETRLVFWTAYSHYTQSDIKGYASWLVRLEQHLGPYSWLKLQISQLPEFYLRTYIDRDYTSKLRQDCSFSYESWYVSYSLPLMKKTWAQVKRQESKEYYNPVFAEFDTEKTGTELKISSTLVRDWRFQAWAEMGSADNVSFQSGLNSTRQDRSYDYLEYGGSIRRTLDCWIKDIALKADFHYREYHTDDPEDPLHAGREHLDGKFTLTMNRPLTGNWNAQLNLRYRNKFTESGYDWVEDLKSFEQFQIWLKISYRFHSDILY